MVWIWWESPISNRSFWFWYFIGGKVSLRLFLWSNFWNLQWLLSNLLRVLRPDMNKTLNICGSLWLNWRLERSDVDVKSRSAGWPRDMVPNRVTWYHWWLWLRVYPWFELLKNSWCSHFVLRVSFRKKLLVVYSDIGGLHLTFTQKFWVRILNIQT